MRKIILLWCFSMVEKRLLKRCREIKKIENNQYLDFEYSSNIETVHYLMYFRQKFIEKTI